jgi:hypothetical protein
LQGSSAETRPPATTTTGNPGFSCYVSAFFLALASVTAYLGRIGAVVPVTVFTSAGLIMAVVAVPGLRPENLNVSRWENRDTHYDLESDWRCNQTGHCLSGPLRDGN